MTYTLMFYLTADEFAARVDPARKVAFWGSFLPYLNAVRESGVLVAGAGLEPPETARAIRTHNGQTHVQDGPFADTKEQLGGFIVIDVPDIDAALEWAARYPAGPGGSVEVRPNLTAEG